MLCSPVQILFQSAPFNFVGAKPSFTIEGWAKLLKPDDTEYLFATRHTTAPASGWAFGTWHNQELFLYIGGGTTYYSDDFNDLFPANQWIHIALVLDSGVLRFYLNGQQVGSDTAIAKTLLSSPEAFQIGASPQSPGWSLANGTLDEVAVYGSALGGDRIRAHYDARYFGASRPYITQQPLAVTTYENQHAYFSVAAEGSPTLNYQWYLNGVALDDENFSDLDIYTDSGVGTNTIQVLVWNDNGETNSATVPLIVLAQPASVNLTRGLVLHLTFDTAGDYTDISGRGNNGAAVGSPTWGGGGPVGAGYFHFSSDKTAKVYNYVTLGQASDLKFGATNNFSISVWVRYSDSTASPIPDLPILANNTTSFGAPGFSFAPYSSAWVWSLYDGNALLKGDYVIGPKNVVNDGAWHHWVFTVDRAGYVNVYIDGALASQTWFAGLGGNLDTTLPINIGQTGTGAYAATGAVDIDDLGVWRRVLSPAEADAIHLVGASGASFAAPVQAAQRVTLSVTRAGNQLLLSWPNGTLEYTDNLKSGGWSAVSGVSGTNYTVVPSPDVTNRFFRVKVQ